MLFEFSSKLLFENEDKSIGIIRTLTGGFISVMLESTDFLIYLKLLNPRFVGYPPIYLLNIRFCFFFSYILDCLSISMDLIACLILKN